VTTREESFKERVGQCSFVGGHKGKLYPRRRVSKGTQTRMASVDALRLLGGSARERWEKSSDSRKDGNKPNRNCSGAKSGSVGGGG